MLKIVLVVLRLSLVAGSVAAVSAPSPADAARPVPTSGPALVQFWGQLPRRSVRHRRRAISELARGGQCYPSVAEAEVGQFSAPTCAAKTPA